MLYPLKFEPIYKSKIWGGENIKSIKMDKSVPPNCGESWEISAVKDDISVISNGFLRGNTIEEIIEIYMEEIVGDKVFEKFGYEFPILLKIIDAGDNLSIQVHPDNDIAAQRHNAWGKSEMWFILNAEQNAYILNGFNRKIDENILLTSINNNDIENIINKISVKIGDSFYIPAGRIHSIGKGITMLEIQQTSDITYRVYDYNRTDRELHLDLATDVIDYKQTEIFKQNYSQNIDQRNQIIENDIFTVNFLPIVCPVKKDYYDIDSFVLYFCVTGSLKLKYHNEQCVDINRGETVLIPADLKILTLIPDSYSELIEVYL